MDLRAATDEELSREIGRRRVEAVAVANEHAENTARRADEFALCSLVVSGTEAVLTTESNQTFRVSPNTEACDECGDECLAGTACPHIEFIYATDDEVVNRVTDITKLRGARESLESALLRGIAYVLSGGAR